VGQAHPLTADLPAWALALLREGRVGRLATADAAGQPLALPVCYVFDGAVCYSPVDAKPKRGGRLRRVANVEVNPRVSLVIDHWDEDWTALRWVLVEGAATLLEEGDERAGAADLLRAKYPQYARLGLSPTAGPMLRIEPARIRAWAYDAGAGTSPGEGNTRQAGEQLLE
jgi:PPOX class probable F420-dependent enzyme